MKASIAMFMAYVHTSVNEVSQQFLSNEKRYNYTTPKSFLEQITLYQNLLREKNRELQAKIVRLENGLEKLRSTAGQVSIRETVFVCVVCVFVCVCVSVCVCVCVHLQSL
jgi:dynein heavy chain